MSDFESIPTAVEICTILTVYSDSPLYANLVSNLENLLVGEICIVTEIKVTLVHIDAGVNTVDPAYACILPHDHIGNVRLSAAVLCDPYRILDSLNIDETIDVVDIGIVSYIVAIRFDSETELIDTSRKLIFGHSEQIFVVIILGIAESEYYLILVWSDDFAEIIRLSFRIGGCSSGKEVIYAYRNTIINCATNIVCEFGIRKHIRGSYNRMTLSSLDDCHINAGILDFRPVYNSLMHRNIYYFHFDLLKIKQKLHIRCSKDCSYKNRKRAEKPSNYNEILNISIRILSQV